MSANQTQLHDSPARYGTLSRFFHWSMAAILAWQFATALVHLLLEDTAIEGFLWGTHKVVGLLLIILIVLRGSGRCTTEAIARPRSARWPSWVTSPCTR